MSNAELVALVKKNPVSFGCGAVSVLLAVAIYFRSDAIPEAETLLAQKTAEAERLTLNVQYSAQLKEQVDTLTVATADIDGRAVRASQLGNNTQYFYRIERDTGVKIVDLRQTTPAVVAKPAKGSFIPVAFSVTAQGTLKQILEFLRQVENGAHFSRVLTASVAGNATQRNSPLTLSFTVELLGVP